MSLLSLVPWWGRWIAIAAIIIACIAFGAIKMHQYDQRTYNKLKLEYSAFKADIKAQGNAAAIKARAQEAADKQRKEKVDADYEKTVTALNRTIASLRHVNPARSNLPAAPAGSRRPDLACFDRAEYQRADGEAIAKLFAGARSLADEGTAATLGLDAAKTWAQQPVAP